MSRTWHKLGLTKHGVAEGASGSRRGRLVHKIACKPVKSVERVEGHVVRVAGNVLINLQIL